MSVLASATAAPRSKTSGAPLWPLSRFAVAISSALLMSGWSLVTLTSGYVVWNALMISP
jgi:hypothetical protein